MPDVYATIADADSTLVTQIADVLELRAGDPQQQAMRQAYLGDVGFPDGARVLEVGCGTGPVTRALAAWPGVAEVTRVDPSSTFLAAARSLDPPSNVRFVEGDARALDIQDRSVDVVVFHTTLCHVPGPEVALGEAARVLVPGGWLAVFDGDYATTTVACIHPTRCRPAPRPGSPPACMTPGWCGACRGCWSGRASGWCGSAASGTWRPATLAICQPSSTGAPTPWSRPATLAPRPPPPSRAEARRRATTGEFFGYIAYASLVSRRWLR